MQKYHENNLNDTQISLEKFTSKELRLKEKL